MDILAVSLLTGDQFHIECSVTHRERWCPTTEELIATFHKKFSGVPPQREGMNTDAARRKHYGGVIMSMYSSLGLDTSKIKRIWISWTVKDPDNLKARLHSYFVQTGYAVEVISFRDVILPELMSAVSTSNYEDEVLRTFSLIKEWQRQAED
jgi:hypothetical protein